jgi:hypothetical protein
MSPKLPARVSPFRPAGRSMGGRGCHQGRPPARVAAGEIAAARRPTNDALLITHKDDSKNSPAAPEARVGAT